MVEREKIAQKIRWLREEQLLTRGELARKAGLTLTSVTNAEEGRHTVRLSTIRKLAKALDVDPSELVHPQQRGPADSGKVLAR